jgi:hypothetical protein
VRITGIATRGPASRRWEREEQRERESRFADAVRAAEELATTRERIRQRIADEREAREHQKRQQQRREEHESRIARIKGGSRA